ncbi:MAG: carbon storage regulator [Helicobacteraceae bacterium]|nr:carbon storage regulator [Helicobacteraceae bacterium]
MLVLSRKMDEEIIIDNNIVIKIISIQNGIVKIGFDAPQDKVILRGELKAAIAGENIKASSDITNEIDKLATLGKIINNKK